MKVAIVYDRVNKWGGAERVLLNLKKIFPDSDLFTSVYNSSTAKWAESFNIKTSFLQKIPFAAKSHNIIPFLMPLAFEYFNFDGYDLVISVTSEYAKGVITKPSTFHLCICLTPTRYLWSGYDMYFRNPVLKFIALPCVWYLRSWDKIAAQRPDKTLAISTEVKKRIKKYYDLNSEVIPLPFENLKKTSKKTDNDFFLVVSRLVYYKRIDLAVKAFGNLGLKLKVIGTGSEEGSLKKIAKENIEFLGEVSDDELSSYYASCKGLIFPGNEDFGLVMVEAQSFGKPVLAFKAGGALDIIREGTTGEFFNEQSVEVLEKSIEKFNNKIYNANLCKTNAERFSFDNFKSKLLSQIPNL